AWLAAILLSTAVAFPAAAQKNPRSPANKAPAVKTKKPTGKTLSEATLRMFKAVELNDMPGVKSSIDNKADLFAENDEGMTAADLAVDKGHFIIAHYLLSRRMLGKTQPIALVPNKESKGVSDAQARKKTKPEAKQKRRFASPPSKPTPPQLAEAPPPPPAPELGIPEKPEVSIPETETPPMRITVAPDKAEPGEELPAPDKTPAEETDVAETAEAPTPSETPAKDAEGETPTQDKPLSDLGVAGFFKSLVDLVTPGGEKPPQPIETAKDPDQESPAPGEAVAEAPLDATDPDFDPVELVDETLRPDGNAKNPFKETIVESTIDNSDEIIVEVAEDSEIGPDGPVEGVEEVVEDVPLSLDEGEQTTLTADAPDKVEEVEEKGFLDRMASLFTSDDKAKSEKAGAALDAPKGVQVTEYELPLPPPKVKQDNNLSPKFLDKLADFLETGDEEAFNAWLPEMQVMNTGVLSQHAKPPPNAAAAPAPSTPQGAPVPATSPKPPVETAAIPEVTAPWSTAVVKPASPAPQVAAEKEAAPEAEKPGMIKGVFNKLVGVLTPDFKSRDRPERLILEPEEKLAAGESAKIKTDGDEETPAYWPITTVETAKKPVVAIRRAPRVASLKTSLNGVTLTLGRSVTLENSYPPGQGVDPRNQCVKKNRGTTLFCLETVDWPKNMQPDFLVPTILYTGQKAIARYDQGIASRFHALFPSESFKRIAQYFDERFGTPTDAWNRSIAPFAQPRQDNPTLAWRSIDPASGVITILEIRKYDDSRGGFPDTNRGAVMLYLANSPPIFPQVSSHELMRLSRGRLGPPPAPPG
ncbi:MAG: hypothetical protein HN719_10130, partial [Alphaproteobacteria bacterium]|nr:hypothetical protein [Alphaproteobacteria bacterium]